MDSIQYNQFKQKLDQIQIYVNDQLFDLAERKIDDLQTQLNQSQQFEQDFLQNQQQFNNLVKVIKETMNNTRFQLKELYSNENWDSNKIDENFIISYKIFSETNTVSIRADAELEIPWFNLVALVYEIDLFVYWFPFCKSARTICKPSKGSKIGYFEMKLPIIHNREAYIQGMGIDRLDENGTILIKCKTIHEEEELLKTFEIQIQKSKNVQVDVNFFSCEIFPVPSEKQKVRIKTISNVNPNVNFLPKWMINFFTKKFGGYLIEKMIKLAKDIKGTKWEEAVNDPQNSEFYTWVKQRVENHNLKIKNSVKEQLQ